MLISSFGVDDVSPTWVYSGNWTLSDTEEDLWANSTFHITNQAVSTSTKLSRYQAKRITGLGCPVIFWWDRNIRPRSTAAVQRTHLSLTSRDSLARGLWSYS